MARARPGLAKAINDILERRGEDGKRLSYRQAERLTGLSPATIGELAKGNARTSETIRRFAQGLGEEKDRLLLLAGFVPESASKNTETAGVTVRADSSSVSPFRASAPDMDAIEPDEREWLERFGQALAKMPPGRERELWKESLRRNTELLEQFLELLVSREPPNTNPPQ